MNNIQFKFCPFCPEPLDDDRQVLIHAIGDHTAEYLKFKNQESLESIFEKLPAIKRTILEKRILAKRRNLDDENDEVLEKIDFVSKLDDVKLSPAALNISSLETSKNDEPVAENAPLSCCSSGYQSGTENDQLSKNEDEENPPKIDSYDDQNHKKIDNLIAPESTSFLDESLPILKVENQVQNSNFPAINDQNFKQIDNDGDQHLNQSIINQQDHQIDSVVVVDDRSIISIPELKTTTTLNDDMDVLFGENGFFALNDEISTILTENMASREPLVDPIIAGPASPQPHRCRNGDAPPPPTSNDQFSVLKSILNATPNYAPPAPRTVFTQEMTPVLTPIVQAQTQPLNDPASAFFVERRRAPILPTPAAIFPPQPQPRAILMTPQPPPIFQTTTTLRRPHLMMTPTQPQPKRCRRSVNGEYKRQDLLYGGTSLTFVDVVVCRVCRIVAGPTEQVLKHEMSEHCLPRYLCPAAMFSLVAADQPASSGRCYNSFPDLEYLRQHVRTSHPDFRLPFVCPFCRSACPDFETYARHALQEYEIRRRRFYRQLTKKDVSIRCKQCKVVAITQLSWLRHRSMCYPNSPYAVADAQLAQQIETSLNLAPPERHYGCQHNSTICEKYPACYFDEDGFLKLSNECPMAHPACEAPNGLCRTPGCFDYHHQNQGGAKFCRFCEPQQINIP